MASQTAKMLIARHLIHILLRSKSNQIMKFDQLRGYSMRKTFFWKDHSKSMVKNLVPDKCWAYLWISCLKFYNLFLFLIQVGYYQHILKLRCFCLMNNFSFFKKKKKEETRDLELNSCSEVPRSLDSLI